MKRPGDSLFQRLPSELAAERSGRVATLRGIIFQSDTTSLNGKFLIRPIEAFDRWQAGLGRTPGDAPQAMHAGLHVELEDGREFVAEQLVGSLFEDFEDGLNWTPVEHFRAREGAGWDVTVPATCFRGVNGSVVGRAVAYLNTIQGRPFFGEDCVAFIERAFGGRRLFGDSPTGMALGVGLRIGDPALPLLRTDARLEPRAAYLLRAEIVQTQPDPLANHDAPNARLWLGRIIVWLFIISGLAILSRLVRKPSL